MTTICIPTCNRPESLTSALTGLIKNLNRYGHTPRILVSDDSENQENANISKEICIQFSKNYSGKIECIDRKERELMAKKIAAEKNIPEEVMIFALCGDKLSSITLGASHNTFLLKTRGDKIIIADDDITYRFFKPKKNSPSFFTIENPMDLFFLKKDIQIPEELEETEADFLSMHEELLSKKVGDILGNLCPEYLKESSIIDTYIGSIGDSTMESHFPILLSQQVQQKIKNMSLEEYKTIKQTDKIAQLSMSTAIYQGLMCISMVMGINNEDSIFPLLPIGRGHDFVFGTTRNKTLSTKLSAHIPIAVGHERPNKESRIISYNFTKEITRMCRIIVSLINEIQDVDIDYLKNVDRVADKFISIAEQPQMLFNLFMDAQCKKITKLTSIYIDDMIKNNTDMPDFWIKDMELTRDELMNPDTKLFLYDITKQVNQDMDKMIIFRKWLLLYGKLLKESHKLTF